MRSALAVVLVVAACSPAAPVVPPPPPVHMVTASILVSHCTNLSPANVKLAQAAMDRLVDGCGAFAGSPVRFTVSLLPGGALQFENTSDAGTSQEIPICLLNHPLKHSVSLQKACSLDVQLEAKSMAPARP